MSKKELKLTAAQDAFVKGLSKEELVEFNKLSNEEKLEVLELQIGIDQDAINLDGKIELESVGYSADGAKILVLDGKGDKGFRGIKAGRKITAQFMGIDYIFSDEPKENWTPVKTADGRALKYRTEFARFRKTDGVEFGIFTAPMLRNALRTLITNSATPNLIDKDPVVTIEYHGLVSKEVAKKDFNFEMTQGSETHAVKVLKEKGALENLDAGIHNYLTSPIPMAKVDREDMTAEEAQALAYSNQIEANQIAAQRNKQIELGLNNAQVSMQ